MSINAYLVFDGNCREAVNYYAEVFQTDEPQIMTFGESPQIPDYKLPDEVMPLIMHARLNIHGSDVMFSDHFPGSPYIVGNNITIAFVTEDLSLLRSAFDHMKKDGKVTMELQETFWSKSYGSLTDKYQVQWQFSHYQN